jgi:hypothetical protein
MLFGRLLRSTGLIVSLTGALLSTPALPQTIAQASTQTAQATVSASRPRATNLRAVLRDWGLDRQTVAQRFTKGLSSSDRAAFSDVRSTDANGVVTTVGQMIVIRDNTSGAGAGQITVEMTNVASTDGTAIANLRLTGISGGAASVNIFKTLLASMRAAGTPNPSRPRDTTGVQTLSIENVSMTNLVSNETVEGKRSFFSIDQSTITNLLITNTTTSFTAIALQGVDYSDDNATLKLTSMTINQAQSVLPQYLSALGGSNLTFKNLAAVSLGGLSLDGLSMTFKKVGPVPTSFGTLTLANLRVGKIGTGFMDQFGFSGFQATGGEGEKAWRVRLARFGMGGVNLDYFSQLGRIITGSLEQLGSKTPPTAAATPSRPAPLASNEPKVFLKDLVKGGPLDSGVASVDLADLSISGGGFVFGIDQMGLKQERNRDGIITHLDFIPTQMRLNLPSLPQTGSQRGLGGMLASLGVQEFRLLFDAGASFNPETDTVSLDKYQFELVDWGRFNVSFAMTGLNRFMSETTMDDLIATSLPDKSSPSGNPMAQLKRLAAFYKGIALTAGRMEFSDLGGLDKALGIAIASSNPRSAPQTNPTPARVLQERASLAAKLRNEYGDKTKPVLMRNFGIATARLFEDGGTMVVEAKPPTPIAISDFDATHANPVARWGLVFTNRPAQVTR